jgi:hypothetical protein
VDLFSFLAFGRDYVMWNFQKTGDPVYLHIKRTPRPDPEEEQPRKKPSIVAIGKDRGRLNCYAVQGFAGLVVNVASGSGIDTITLWTGSL